MKTAQSDTHQRIAAAVPGLRIAGPLAEGDESVLSPGALSLLALLERRFRGRRRRLLRRNALRQARLERGALPGFLPRTRRVREGNWRVAPPPADLQDRRVEITGPVDRKMVINALNSGARAFMADFEDATSPTWRNVVEGQIHLRDAVRGTIEHVQPGTGKVYRLRPDPATLMVRPRGWHLPEQHVWLDGEPVSGSLFDFSLYLHHNARALLEKGSAPYFYLPKLESHLEARLWNDVFLAAQEALGLPRGTIRATVLIETLPAAFEMDEILFELREHAAGLNCGRWDYIFSFLKCFRADPTRVLPDRALVTMEQPFLRAYSRLLVRTCHRRGAHAIGGMAAHVPSRDDPQRTARALEQVRRDKAREAADGHDGTWVAHPGLVEVARAEFDAAMPGPHQMARSLEDVEVAAEDLLAVPRGPVTEEGLRLNLGVGLQYLRAWLGGVGCVPLHGLMEDAATAEISRAQVWQWLRHRVRLEDGRPVDEALVRHVLAEELESARGSGGPAGAGPGRGPDRLDLAARLLLELVTAEELEEFLTLRAYDHIVTPA